MPDNRKTNSPVLVAHIPKAGLYRNLWFNFRRYLGPFLLGGVFVVLSNLFSFEIPKLIGTAIAWMKEGATPTGEPLRQGVRGLAWLIIAYALIGGGSRILSRIAIFNAGRNIEFDLRNTLYQKLTRLDPRFYHSMRTGDLTSRVTNDVTHVRVLYAISFLHLVNTSVAYAIGLQKMFVMNWRLTLITLIPFLFLLYLIKQFVQKLFIYSKEVQTELSGITTHIQETLSGISIIKTYNLENNELASFGEKSKQFVSTNLKVAKVRAGLDATSMTVVGLGSFLVLLVGSFLLARGEMTVGDFVTFNGYVTALAFPTTAMGWVFSCWNRGLASYTRIIDVLEAPEAIQSPETPTPLPPRSGSTGAVTLEHVTFSYGSDAANPIIKNITLNIEAGSTVAIVGKTGSGKSTLAKLLVRFYDPDQGAIRLDGVDLRELNIREARSEIGMVSQEPFLFSMPLLDNIHFGLDAMKTDGTIQREPPNHSLFYPDKEAEPIERITEATEIAGLTGDLTGFTSGLDTLVGERGITLSGGQKQRTTIARALLVDPRLLILDDALSAVDTKTESLIMDHLQEVMRQRTSILITHRFNSLERVDRIFVLDEGRLVDEGTHAELADRPGIYRDLWEKQQLNQLLSREEERV